MSALPHGTFSFHREGQVLHLSLAGVSNLEGAQARADGLRAVWQDWVARDGQPSRWAMLVDLRRWQGGTPEAFAQSGLMMTWTIDQGLVAVACLMDDPLLQRLVERHIERAEGAIASVVLNDMAEARQWLRDQGFALGPDPQ